ncbi:MAG: hypothetical protein WC905_02305 [Patescibacteria group bacterium]
MKRMMILLAAVVLISMSACLDDPVTDDDIQEISEEPTVIICNESQVDMVIEYSTDADPDVHISAIIRSGDEYDVESGVSYVSFVGAIDNRASTGIK